MSEAIQTGRAVPPGFRLRGLWRRSKRSTRRKPPLARAVESACIVVLATLAYWAFGELAVRVAIHAPLLQWRDFRRERAVATINKVVQYDSLLGWRLKPFLATPGFHTLAYGFRSNGGADAGVKPGGVLAVGSSFTAGSEVVDAETWPAHLQQLTGWNVNNAGEGGYQADQIVLLGEQLLPLVRPQVLVVDLIPGTIIGTGYTSFGWPKPYFTIDNGALAAHNAPVPHADKPRDHAFDIKGFLGHSAALDRFMATLFAGIWFTSDGNSFANVSTDEVGVTCRLLAGLKQKADAAGARMLLYLQYPGPEVVDGSRMAAERRMAAIGRLYDAKRWIKNRLRPWLLHTPPGAPDWNEASAAVGACARTLNIPTVDELAALMAVYETNPEGLRKYYQTEPDGTMGHKSSFGNMEAAKLVAAAIRQSGPPPDQKSK